MPTDYPYISRYPPEARTKTSVAVDARYSYLLRPLRYSINVTLDECCNHRAVLAEV